MGTHNLSEYDRALLSNLTTAVSRLASAMEEQKVEKVYTCKEAAALLDKTPQTISRYLRQGKLKRAVRGGVIGIPESELKKITPQ